VKLLKQNDFTEEQAVYGADNCGADWFKQAEKAAEEYGNGIFSDKEALKKFLQREGFTEEQINQALN